MILYIILEMIKIIYDGIKGIKGTLSLVTCNKIIYKYKVKKMNISFLYFKMSANY